MTAALDATYVEVQKQPWPQWYVLLQLVLQELALPHALGTAPHMDQCLTTPLIPSFQYSIREQGCTDSASSLITRQGKGCCLLTLPRAKKNVPSEKGSTWDERWG